MRALLVIHRREYSHRSTNSTGRCRKSLCRTFSMPSKPNIIAAEVQWSCFVPNTNNPNLNHFYPQKMLFLGYIFASKHKFYQALPEALVQNVLNAIEAQYSQRRGSVELFCTKYKIEQFYTQKRSLLG